MQRRVIVSGSLSHLLYDLLLPCIIRVAAVNLSVRSLSNLHCNCHELYQLKFKLTENVPFSSPRGWKNHYWGEWMDDLVLIIMSMTSDYHLL